MGCLCGRVLVAVQGLWVLSTWVVLVSVCSSAEHAGGSLCCNCAHPTAHKCNSGRHMHSLFKHQSKLSCNLAASDASSEDTLSKLSVVNP